MEQASFQFDFLPDEQAVYSLLKSGRAYAITARDLAERTGLSDRQIRQVVKDLIMKRGLLVASAVDDPAGFYLATTREEILAATKGLRHRGISILARAAKLQRSGIEIVFNLARLEFEEEKHGTLEMR